jgi:uncharacterized protein YkwD
MSRARLAVPIAAAALAVGILGAGTASGQASGCAGANAEAGSTPPADLAATVTCLINEERAKAGLAALTVNSKLLTAESAHVSDMLRNRYIGHLGTDGSLPFERARATGYVKKWKTYVLGEDLAWGQSTAGTPAKVVAAWMNSPTHRRNILGTAFRDIASVAGTGAPINPGTALDGTATTYGVMFGFVKRRK